MGARGTDALALLIAANPGLPAAPLSQTASGGELSRIALAIRVAARSGGGPATLLLDEVDAGVGGRTANAVGEKLKALARQRPAALHHAPAADRGTGRRPLPRREAAGRPDGDAHRPAPRRARSWTRSRGCWAPTRATRPRAVTPGRSSRRVDGRQRLVDRRRTGSRLGGGCGISGKVERGRKIEIDVRGVDDRSPGRPRSPGPARTAARPRRRRPRPAHGSRAAPARPLSAGRPGASPTSSSNAAISRSSISTSRVLASARPSRCSVNNVAAVLPRTSAIVRSAAARTRPESPSSAARDASSAAIGTTRCGSDVRSAMATASGSSRSAWCNRPRRMASSTASQCESIRGFVSGCGQRRNASSTSSQRPVGTRMYRQRVKVT